MKTNVYHESIGQGETVVFLHSAFTDSRMWDEQWQALSKNYRLLRYDRAGFGKTAPNGDAPHSRTELLALLDDLGIEKAHLVGCSGGGEIIMDFALEHPERVKSLTLVSSIVTGFPMEGEPPAELMALFGALQTGNLDEVAKIATRLFLVGEQRKEEELPLSLREAVQEQTLTIGKNGALMQEEAEPLNPPAMQQLSEIAVPTLLMVGKLDNPELSRAAKVIAQAIEGAQVVEIANAAHFPNMEQPAAFNDAFATFLAKQKR
jgi:2-hydroxy-6-oxonona-2,4-dienedioate hydrolase